MNQVEIKLDFAKAARIPDETEGLIEIQRASNACSISIDFSVFRLTDTVHTSINTEHTSMETQIPRDQSLPTSSAWKKQSKEEAEPSVRKHPQPKSIYFIQLHFCFKNTPALKPGKFSVLTDLYSRYVALQREVHRSQRSGDLNCLILFSPTQPYSLNLHPPQRKALLPLKH